MKNSVMTPIAHGREIRLIEVFVKRTVLTSQSWMMHGVRWFSAIHTGFAFD